MMLYLITFLFMVILIGLLFFLKEKSIKEFVVAFLMSLSWVLFYGYNYKGTNLFLFGKINVFALVAWTLGLLILGFFWERINKKYDFFTSFFLTGFLCVLSLNVFEWIGYNILKIQLTSSYYGLWGFEMIHGPWFMKFYYLTAWMFYIGIIELINKDK